MKKLIFNTVLVALLMFATQNTKATGGAYCTSNSGSSTWANCNTQGNGSESKTYYKNSTYLIVYFNYSVYSDNPDNYVIGSVAWDNVNPSYTSP